MAVLDAVAVLSAGVTNGSFVEVQPSGTVQWVIHNIYGEGAFELYWYDGTNSIKIDTEAAVPWLANLELHVTNSVWVRIKNTSGSTFDFGYDGIVSHA
jgi:hypothetical protein